MEKWKNLLLGQRGLKMYKPLVMSNEEYHGKTKYESSSTIRKALVNPKKYLYDKTAETVPTKAMEEGTAKNERMQKWQNELVKFITLLNSATQTDNAVISSENNTGAPTDFNAPNLDEL